MEAYTLNKDSLYCFDGDTIKKKFKGVFNPYVRNVCSRFTRKSKNLGAGLGCIIAALKKAKATKIDNTDVESALTLIAKERGSLNQSIVKFVKVFLRLFARRLKFMIASIALQKKLES